MDIYTAIMKAADHIEQRPELFDFKHSEVPDPCGTPGCAIGWIGYFLGVETHHDLWFEPTLESMGFSGDAVDWQDDFYERMDSLAPSWKHNASECARGLRAYAKKYHAPEKPKHEGTPRS